MEVIFIKDSRGQGKKGDIKDVKTAKNSEVNYGDILFQRSSETREEFKKADRADLVEKLEVELKIVDQYLPEQLSDDEVRVLVQETIDEVGAESMKDMGTVMSAVMPKVQGRADGGQINGLVRELLSK